MKYIITIITKIFSKELPKPMGRWKIDQCNKQMISKIDLSNEDHCGPCGQYALKKIEIKEKQYNDSKQKQYNDSKEKN
uniref:Uncharacterized protein n=1 Tax=viral metagenome TaxID=1070528 RepID=A0A6C0AR99_9ZZZZ